MDAQTLADRARAEAALFDCHFHKRIVSQLALAHVAWWLDQQDESIRAKAADTACEAMRLLRTYP